MIGGLARVLLRAASDESGGPIHRTEDPVASGWRMEG